MGVRQSINENAKLGVGIGAGILVVAICLISYQLFGGDHGIGVGPNTAFFSDDNGKTFFRDDIYKVVPFTHNGKQAYRADVFKCADGKEFVGLLYRHTTTGRHEVEQYVANKMMDQDRDGSALRGIELRSMEIKRAGADDKAFKASDESLIETLRRSVKCPSGGAVAEYVSP